MRPTSRVASAVPALLILLVACGGASAYQSHAGGTGLFDVHPKLGSARAEVRLSGRATAACSPRCEAGGVLSLDWHAPGAEMRIQVDRVFADASGAIASLEITDVLADQAEQYVGVHSNKF